MVDALARLAEASAADRDEETPERAEPETEDGDLTAAVADIVDWERSRGVILRGLAAMLDNVDARDAGAMMAAIEAPALLQGRRLSLRETVPVTTELEMPFGAPALRFVGTIGVESVDRRENVATVVRRVTLDQESGRAAALGVADFLVASFVSPLGTENANAKMAEDFYPQIRSTLETLGLGYTETSEGVVDLATGMVRETRTDYVLQLERPGEEGAENMVLASGRTVIRITPGAPVIPKLPRP